MDMVKEMLRNLEVNTDQFTAAEERVQRLHGKEITTKERRMESIDDALLFLKHLELSLQALKRMKI